MAGPLLAVVLAPAAFGDDSALLEKSRQITADYATQLQAALTDAMAAGGPVEAINVCAELAPRLGSVLSRTTGARVRRTSVRFRNPANAPDPQETRGLEHLQSTGAGEYVATDSIGGTLYMKPIPTAPLCLVCHGETLSSEIQAGLDDAYPHDRARGFQAGDLRGAFSVYWPAATSANAEK